MEEGEGFKEKVLNAHQEVQVLLKQLSQQDFKEIQDKISLLETSINDIVQQRSITDSKIKELDPSFSQIEELRDRIDQIQANNVTETVSIKSQPQSETGNSSELMDYETLLTKKTDPALDLKKLESYLSDDEFMRVFKVNKEEFYKLPTWQQERRKKQANLF